MTAREHEGTASGPEEQTGSSGVSTGEGPEASSHRDRSTGSETGAGTETGADAGEGSAGPETGEDGPEAGAGPRDRAGRKWGEAFSDVGDVVGDMVGDVLEGVRGVAAGRRFPRMDLIRVAGGYRLYVDLPGLARDQVQVTTLGGQLTISGERPRPELPEGAEVLRTERGFGTFERTMRMPPDVREEDVAASLDDGVLVLELPRTDASEAHDVEIG